MPIAYETSGEGEPLVLIHGFPFDASSWWPILESPPRGVKIIAPHLRGFGRSPLGDTRIATMDTYAQDVLDLLDALKIDTAFVGGLSMGGYVAIALTRLDPGRVRGLLLVDTQSVADDDAGKAKREATALDVEQNGSKAVVDGLMTKLFAAGTDQSVKSRVETMMRAQDAKSVAAASRGMATRVDGKDILSRFSGPCSIVVGNEDTITPLAKAKAMQDLVKDSTLEVVTSAGHLTPVEQPIEFASIVVKLITAGR